MTVFSSLRRNKSVAMPVVMVLGMVLCRPVTAFNDFTGDVIPPALIFVMLFFTFCRVDPRRMRFSWMHAAMLVFQIAGGVGAWFALRHFNPIIAQGVMICILTPIAAAAIAVGGMLGADIVSMTSYSMICNTVIALVAPVVFTFAGNGECTFAEIMARVVPLLVMPFVAAQLCRRFLPRVSGWVERHAQVSFYAWLLSLFFIMGSTTVFIAEYPDLNVAVAVTLAAAALVVCLFQFAAGRFIGRLFGDSLTCGQSLGQKNTVLAIWMAQSFLDPLSCIAPTAYIVWQNAVNSVEIYRHDARR